MPSFIESSFGYDTLVIEEAGQLKDIETFITFNMQKLIKYQDGKLSSRLKRIILIGDDDQLPPIIKNIYFQKAGNLEQSMFKRLIRMGVPAIRLSHQGRARQDILKLYQWKYNSLVSLPCVLPNVLDQMSLYNYANAGFRFTYQFVDVPDHQGKGETQPSQYFYQNLAEAEFVVATFMYLCLVGYKPEQITILTTYAGQKYLIRDIVHQKCSWNQLFRKPNKITTVDKYQGQQNDIILLSLVRTLHVGHIRDPRRLIVALSRARLGLYVFGRMSLFENFPEMRKTFELFKMRGNQLQILQSEDVEKLMQNKRSEEDTESIEIKCVSNFEQMYLIVKELLKHKIQNEELKAHSNNNQLETKE